MIKKIIHSPLLYFIVFGIAAYFLYQQVVPDAKESIIVTQQTIDALVQQQESLSQFSVKEEDKEQLIQNYIDEEVLLREAYKRGLDKSDYRVRKRILSIMRSALTEVYPEPTYAELRAWYDENLERYMGDTTISFSHVYFAFSNDDLPEDPSVFISQIDKADDFSVYGDFFSYGNTMLKSSFQNTSLIFGKNFAEALFAATVGEWSGPVESIQGIHYFRPDAVHEPEAGSFESLESYLRTDYFLTKTREEQQKKINRLREKYSVEFE